jgi:hypothetical protein
VTTCSRNPGAAASPALEALRQQFWEYCQGSLSEKDFKLAVAEYSQSLRAARATEAQLVAEELVRARA